MEEKTKQRLIGVLVLLGVLFIILPFLFHNSQPSVADKIRAEEAATTTNAASQPTVTLPPENATLPAVNASTINTNAPAVPAITPAPTTPAPAPIVPVVAPTTTPAPPVATPTPAKTSSLSDNHFQPDHSVSPVSGLTTGEASAAQATAEATPSVTAPAETTTETAVVHHTHHAVAAHHHAIQKHHPAAAAHWTVQLAVFSEKRNAEKLISTLRAHHFPVHARHIRHNHFPMIAVFVGPEINEARAIAMQQRLHHEFHLTGVVRKIEV